MAQQASSLGKGQELQDQWSPAYLEGHPLFVMSLDTAVLAHGVELH